MSSASTVHVMTVVVVITEGDSLPNSLLEKDFSAVMMNRPARGATDEPASEQSSQACAHADGQKDSSFRS